MIDITYVMNPLKMIPMPLNTKLTNIQKVLLFVLQKERRGEKTFFQDIQEHLNRSQPQISRLLTKLDTHNFIIKDTTRPQSIRLTDRGKEHIETECIQVVSSYIPQSEPKEPTPNSEPTYTTKLSPELIQDILSEIEEGITADLELIQEFITRDAFNSLKSQIMETIELSLGNYT